MNSTYATSSTLLDRLQKNQDPESWQRFIDIYSVMIRRWNKDYGVSATDAADVAQEILMHVFNNITHFQNRHPGGFRAWLRSIARNKIRKICRKSKPESLHSIGMADLIDHRSWPKVEDERPELKLRAMEVVKPEFGPSTWRLFESVFLHGGKPGEIAKENGVTINCVYIARSRVLSRVRQVVQQLKRMDGQ